MIVITQRSDVLGIARSEVENVPRAAVLVDVQNKRVVVSVPGPDRVEPILLFPNALTDIAGLLADHFAHPRSEIRICVDVQLLPSMATPTVVDELRAILTNQGRVVLHPVSSHLLSVFAEYITHGASSMSVISRIGLAAAGNNMLRFFVHLPGLAHSAQDIISYFKLHARWAGKQGSAASPTDTVLASIPEGSEMFVIQKTKRSPHEVEASDMGLCYFPIFNKYKAISPPLATKLALCSACEEYCLSLGYAVIFHPESRKDHYEENRSAD